MPDIEVTIQTTPIEVFVSQVGAQGPAGQQGASGAPGGVITLNGLSGVLNVSGVGEINVTTGSNSILISGNFYPANSNPSGFITGVDLSSYVTTSQTGQFYSSSNPSGYITGVDLSSYATINYVTGVSGVLENQINSLNFWTGKSTGLYYPLNSNPSGYLRYENLTDLIQIVKNDGRALPKGAAVYVSGAEGNNVIVDAADYNSEATSSKTLGLLAQSLAINATGYVINQGILGGLTIPDGVNEGDPVWLGETGSLIYGLTNKPYAPKHLVYLGVVTRNQGGQGGVDSIFVNVQNGYELEELHNVNARNPINKNVIIYDSASGIWINRQITTGDISGMSLYLTGVNLTSYVTTGQTGAFYPASNPSGFITGVDLSSYVLKTDTGNANTLNGQGSSYYLTFNNMTGSLISVGSLQLSGNLLSTTGNNQSLILGPNGNGALITDINGDVRGSYANDFQRARTTNSQVAAGSHSLIGGGSGNFALGNNSVVCGGINNIAATGSSTIGGGSSNIASGLYSFIPGGYQAKATRQGEFAHAIGSFSNPGDAQTFRVVMRTETTGSRRQLTTNGQNQSTNNSLIIPPDTAWQFTIRAAAVCTNDAAPTVLGSTAGWHIRGAAKRIGNVSSLVPTGTQPAGSSLSWRDAGFGGPQLEYGMDANHRLYLSGNALNESSSAVIRWVAAVEVTQVSFGTP